MDKKKHILDSMEALFREGKGGTASVSEIARKAGIAKGGMYYYFHSKEEVLDALVRRHYEGVIASCRSAIESSNGNALENLALLLSLYQSQVSNVPFDEYLHLPQNAAIHQKSLSEILLSLSPLITQIICQGVEEKIFTCDQPQEYAEIILSVFTFLLDPGIFSWSEQEKTAKLKVLAHLLERGLCTKEGSFRFLY